MSGVPTGATATFRHPRCWASSRNNCDRKISLEHYVSNAVLDVLGVRSVRGEAFTGQKPGIDILSKNFGANVLCRQHNSELSRLDSVAQLVFLAQRLFVAEINKSGFVPEDEQIDVSGDDLERWILKTLITHAVAKIFTARGDSLSPPDLTRATQLVFEDHPWPARWGLWMQHRTDIVLNLGGKIELEPIWMLNGHSLGGGRVTIGGLEFWLSLFSPASGDGGPFDGATHRPSGIVYQFPNFKKVICFSWRDGPTSPSISYRVSFA